MFGYKRTQRETAARKGYETYWESYANGELETFASTLDETDEMIDTSVTEVCQTKADGIDFLKRRNGVLQVVTKEGEASSFTVIKPLIK